MKPEKSKLIPTNSREKLCQKWSHMEILWNRRPLSLPHPPESADDISTDSSWISDGIVDRIRGIIHELSTKIYGFYGCFELTFHRFPCQISVSDTFSSGYGLCGANSIRYLGKTIHGQIGFGGFPQAADFGGNTRMDESMEESSPCCSGGRSYSSYTHMQM